MVRRATGSVLPPEGSRRSWALRFRAYGERRYVTLGRPDEGWSQERADAELRHVLADVERGIWRPPPSQPVKVQHEPTFGEFAEEWFEGCVSEWRERTRVNHRWRLDSHLLPFFERHRLSEITIREVDDYRRSKVKESQELESARQKQLSQPKDRRERLPRPLSNGSINKTIRLLAAILELAVEYGYLDRNPAKGRKRLLRERKPPRTYLQPEQLAALLTAAAELDRRDRGRREPLLAVLALAGLRISEALDLRWRDVSMGERKLWVEQAKTDAGVREVDLTPMLQRLLAAHRLRSRHSDADDFVFATGRGGHESPSNVRIRFLAPAVKRANEELAKESKRAMSGITPHSLRRTFVSLLLAAGADVPYAMAQVGHTDPKMTLGIYAQVMAFRRDHGVMIDGLIDPSHWAELGIKPKNDATGYLPAPKPKQRKTPR
jgi:integrase